MFQCIYEEATYSYDEFHDHLIAFLDSGECDSDCRCTIVDFLYCNLWTFKEDFLEAMLPACLPSVAEAGSDYDRLKREIPTYVSELIHRGFDLPLTSKCVDKYFPKPPVTS
jgi:hypothetical protein